MKNRKKILCLLLTAAICISLFACSASPAPMLTESTAGEQTENTREETEQNPIPEDAMKGNAADFAIRLLQNMNTEKDNCILSPYSILTALAMAANGADGETLSQMEAAFGMTADELTDLLSESYAASGEELISANALWFPAAEGFTPSDIFVGTNRDAFGAEINPTDFSADAINGWIKEHTKERIARLIEQLPADAAMVLANALTFDAAWEKPYTEKQLHDGIFTAADGTQQSATMLYGKEQTYLDDGMATGFIKPYAGGQYAYVALLPNQGVSMQEYLASLTGEKLLQTVHGASQETVNTQMPAFSAETSAELSAVLQKLGILDAFTPDADFGKIAEFPLCISQVLHKTYLKVDAGGTEAAAATAVVMTKGATRIQNNKQVILDRPYVMAILDQTTDTVLFLGVVNDV